MNPPLILRKRDFSNPMLLKSHEFLLSAFNPKFALELVKIWQSLKFRVFAKNCASVGSLWSRA